MGKKGDAAKKGLIVTFLAAGGAGAGLVHAGEAAAAREAASNPEAVVSSYFGGLGLQDDFVLYLKQITRFNSFLNFYKEMPQDAIRVVAEFSELNQVPGPHV